MCLVQIVKDICSFHEIHDIVTSSHMHEHFWVTANHDVPFFTNIAESSSFKITEIELSTPVVYCL